MTARLADPVLRRVAAADPARADDAGLTPAEAARADALLARLEATPRGTASSAHRRRRRLPGTIRTRLAATGAAVLAVVGAMILVPTTASAEGVLLQAADAAALQPEATGEYWYVHWQITDLFEGVRDYDREIWLGRDDGMLRDGFAAAVGAKSTGQIDPADLRNERLDGPVYFGEEVQFTWDELAALPTDAHELKATLEATVRERSGDVSDLKLYSAAVGLLNETPASPQLRRALWQVLADIPELTLGSETTDALGRAGVLISVDFPEWQGNTQVMVIDPVKGTVLEHRWFAGDRGTLDGWRTLVEQGPRDEVPAADPPRCGSGSVPYQSC